MFNFDVCENNIPYNNYFPRKSTDKSAGFDIPLEFDTYIGPNEIKFVKTLFTLHTDGSYYGYITSRSSYIKRGVITIQSIIDNDYEDEFHLILHNVTEKPITLRAGEYPSQIIPCYYCNPDSNVKSLFLHRRGGIGSTERRLNNCA